MSDYALWFIMDIKVFSVIHYGRKLFAVVHTMRTMIILKSKRNNENTSLTLLFY
jgi:hypothetical protein